VYVPLPLIGSCDLVNAKRLSHSHYISAEVVASTLWGTALGAARRSGVTLGLSVPAVPTRFYVDVVGQPMALHPLPIF